MDTKDSKYYKIFLGKTILWPRPLSTFEENLNECHYEFYVYLTEVAIVFILGVFLKYC